MFDFESLDSSWVSLFVSYDSIATYVDSGTFKNIVLVYSWFPSLIVNFNVCSPACSYKGCIKISPVLVSKLVNSSPVPKFLISWILSFNSSSSISSMCSFVNSPISANWIKGNWISKSFFASWKPQGLPLLSRIPSPSP